MEVVSAGQEPESAAEGAVVDKDADELLHHGSGSSMRSESRRRTCLRGDSVDSVPILSHVSSPIGSGFNIAAV